MDCPEFFAVVEATLADRCERPTRSTPGDQCVFEFFHPRVADRLGTDGLATRFNRSGVVWAPRRDRLAVQVRVPAAHDDAVSTALAAAPFAVERTDHRRVSAPGGEVVAMLHYSIRASDVSPDAFDATLSAVAVALAVSHREEPLTRIAPYGRS